MIGALVNGVVVDDKQIDTVSMDVYTLNTLGQARIADTDSTKAFSTTEWYVCLGLKEHESYDFRFK